MSCYRRTGAIKSQKDQLSASFQYKRHLAMDKLTVSIRGVVCLLVALWIARLRQRWAGEVSHSDSRQPPFKEGSIAVVAVRAWRKSSESWRQEISSDKQIFLLRVDFFPSA